VWNVHLHDFQSVLLWQRMEFDGPVLNELLCDRSVLHSRECDSVFCHLQECEERDRRPFICRMPMLQMRSSPSRIAMIAILRLSPNVGIDHCTSIPSISWNVHWRQIRNLLRRRRSPPCRRAEAVIITSGVPGAPSWQTHQSDDEGQSFFCDRG
jgi:hypothetical protein